MDLSALKSKSLLLSMLGVVILVVGVVAVIMLMPESQDTRRQAAVEGGTATISISPGIMELSPGDEETATVSFSTKGSEIQGVTVRLQYPMDGDAPNFTTDNIVISSAMSDFDCSNPSILTNNNESLIDVSCVYLKTGGFNSENVGMFSFDVTAKDEPTTDPVTIAFDAAKTVVAVAPVAQNPAQDIAAIPTGTLKVSVGSDEEEEVQKTTDLDYEVTCDSNQVTAEATFEENGEEKGDVTVEFTYNNATETAISNSSGVATAQLPKAGEDITLRADPEGGYPSKSMTVILPTCSSEEDDSSSTSTSESSTANTTGSATGGVCSTSCEYSRDCYTGLSCINGLCRDSRCPTDQTCQCNSTDPTSTTGDTELPESGFDQTALMMIVGLVFVMGGAGLLFTFAPIKQS